MKYKLIYGIHVLVGEPINHDEVFSHLSDDEKKKAIAEAKKLNKPDKVEIPEKESEVK